MRGFFDPANVALYKSHSIILDTNILSSMYANERYLQFIIETFSKNELFLDPIVKLEFLRGAFSELDFDKKSRFLEYEGFLVLPNHQEIFKKVYDNAFNISRIYAHNGNPGIPLGDILIISRLMLYNNFLFLTLDKGDFSTVLFDRRNVISIEKSNSKGKLILEHLNLLEFNKEKYDICLHKLPKTS